MTQRYYEATARERIDGILDAGSFAEILGPTARVVSPHLEALDLPVAFDDGVVVGTGTLDGMSVAIAAQEGRFMGGAVGEVHGAKIVGIVERALNASVRGIVLLLESGGVRLQEANAALVGVSEVIRAILDARANGMPVACAIGGQYGCFGGMGIAASACTAVVMSEDARLGLSGPEVIETAAGVEEFDSRDRALVWRTTGGKHRYLIGDCSTLVDDDVDAFRHALASIVRAGDSFGLELLEREQALFERRLQRFGGCNDAEEIWRLLGWPADVDVPSLATDRFLALAANRREVP